MMAAIKHVEVGRSATDQTTIALDALAVEEPLEIRIEWECEGEARLDSVGITMRTPGNDEELAAGFLFTEGLIQRRSQVVAVRSCRANSIRVALAPGTSIDLTRVERRSYTTSSCGMCGKTSLAALELTSAFPLRGDGPCVDARLVRSLPAALRGAQPAFDATGGLHASALFDLAGNLITLREDVGRHNALDKVIGTELLAGRLPADERILIVSGRVSFELVQKALMAGIPMLAAIGAPSSLAVELAQSAGMTLLGFVRTDRFNVYAGAERLAALV